MKVARTVVGVLSVACFAGSGALAYSYFQPTSTPTPGHIDKVQVWHDLQQRRDLLQQETPAPLPAPTHDDSHWEGI